MHFATEFATLTAIPSRAKNPLPKYVGDDPDWPSFLAPLDAAKMFLEAAKREFPDLLTIKTGEIIANNFSLEPVCTKFDLSPDVPFCVINDYADIVRANRIPPAERYREGGFPIYGDIIHLDLILNIARLCELDDQIPPWMKIATKFQTQNWKNGISAPYTVTYHQAKEYSRFIHKVRDEAYLYHDPCLIEDILAQDLVYLQDALSTYTPHLSVLNYSIMFSAPVVERIVERVTNENLQSSQLPRLLINEIEENLPFWVRCRGVIAHAMHDC